MEPRAVGSAAALMALWLGDDRLHERRAAARGPLAPLARSLAADLEPVLAREIVLPPEKARLSRDGGRCAADGSYLRFDPASPRSHQCPRCGRTYAGEAHYRWWIMGYHLWLAERAVHAALLHALGGDERHRRFAEEVLARYADAYLGWPNQDNVLGPTRPFFSTYLESIWLLQLCVALDLLEGAGAVGSLGGTVRERLVAPSVALVAGYDEGMSNRQVWNVAALLAGAALLGDRATWARAAHGPSGISAHLQRSLLADGSWYEGENYHLFAHRGLWYGVHLVQGGGGEVACELLRRFDEGFATPFLTALPDFTFPARRDSQYAVSLRQWRFAELAELGLARRPDDRRLHHALARLYDADAAPGDTGRWRSTAEAERNEPPARLDRASLGWRSLLVALPELPALRPSPPRSLVLERQGYAVLRRDGERVYAALDYGTSGGGHGHPDRLDLLLSVGDERWLDDPGTGSYVDPSLFWYRGTLAHCAPLVNGASQQPADGVLLAWEERGAAGWADAAVAGAAPGVVLRRTVVAMPDYLVDELSWTADRPVRVELPVRHAGALAGVGEWEPVAPAALEVDGAGFLRDTAMAAWHGDAATLHRDVADATDVRPAAWFLAGQPGSWWRATAPGAPGRAPGPLHVARLRGDAGRLASVWSWRGAVRAVEQAGDELVVRMENGEEHRHVRRGRRWHVELLVGGARSSIDLAGERAEPLPAAGAPASAERADPDWSHAARLDARRAFHLAEGDYRRSEATWREAGCPTADVTVVADGGMLHVHVHARLAEIVEAAARAVNDMDNERAEVNATGVQLHLVLPALATADEPQPVAGWLCVPEGDDAVRAIPLDARAAALPLAARRHAAPDGLVLDVLLPLASLGAEAAGTTPLGIGVVVNETVRGRERRRGQLVLGGAAGEFVYLRGDRHPAERCLPFLIPA